MYQIYRLILDKIYRLILRLKDDLVWYFEYDLLEGILFTSA